MSRFKINTPRESHENPNTKFQSGLNKLWELKGDKAKELLKTFTEMRENQRGAGTWGEVVDKAAWLIYEKIEEVKGK